MKIEKVKLNDGKAVLTSYLLGESLEFVNIDARPAVLIFPGGGYHFTSDREAEPIAMSFMAEGFNAFVLHYSVGKNEDFSSPWKDATEALALIRKKAVEWNIESNKIGVVGFSAGGHLAAALGTMGNERPNAMILGYPCILSSIGDVLAFPVPSLEKEVDELTPPTFLFSTCEDQVVPVEHTIHFMHALNEKKIPFESHIFQAGNHGLSLAKSHTSSGMASNVDDDVAGWFSLSVAWLKKVFGDFPVSDGSMMPDVNDTSEYSIDVKLEPLLEHPECRSILLEYVPAFNDSDISDSAKDFSLRIVNRYYLRSLSESQLIGLDKRLKEVPYNERE